MHSSGAAEKGARGLEPLSNRLWRALVPSSCLWGLAIVLVGLHLMATVKQLQKH